MERRMKIKPTTILFLTVTLGLAFPVIAQTPQPSAIPRAEVAFEELPVLNASDILQPDILTGPHHKVREEVPTYSGANHFTIDSDFGVFEADGNEMLLRRINEINAIARLKEVSRTDEFKEALRTAAKSPMAAAKAIANDPVRTITNVPKGVMKFMGRIGENAKGIGEKHQANDPEGTQLQQVIGFSDAKRKVAISLGVDPYSTNTVLQHELDQIAWASFTGGAAFTLATLPVSGAAGTALTVTEVSGDFNDVLKEKSPTDLRIMNRKALLDLGATESEAERFLNNNAFSPSAQTAFVLNLRSMKGVANRRAFVRLAGEPSSSETDAIFCVQTAALMSKLNKDEIPLARIELLGEFPICVAKDGTTIVALQWDYAAWTPGAAHVSDEVEKFAAKPPRNKKVLIALSGQVSPHLRQELEARGELVKDRVAPGPLK
ncbi:MAG: hypothetical protein DME55_11980 [Verrucomicrobia bacterium]|nr:MAG: hypothetical protein DME55_11980 [Verrucomicrobiota bacterium]